MSRTLGDYRSVQIDIRVIELALGAINDEEKYHPEKAHGNTDSLAKQHAWAKVRAEFDRRRAYLRKQLAAKEDQKSDLYLSLSQQPLSMQSLASIIDRLTYAEAGFATDDANTAWDRLSHIIDGLEKDAERVKGLKAA